MVQTGIIILAAGNSSRLGKPKQLLEVEGKTLLQRICNAAKAAQLAPIVVVLGSNADQIANQHIGNGINFVINDSWQKGMSSSIVAGLMAIFEHEIENLIISVCDQPYINAALFVSMIEKQKETNKGIVACKYGDTVGTPVLFQHQYFNDLMLLTGKEGAKKIVNSNTTDLATVDFEKGNIDIDTEADYRYLLKNLR